MSTTTTAGFLKTVDKAFKKSLCRARTRKPTTPSYFQMVTARQPVCGFGSFNASGSSAFNPAYNDDWPRVFNHQSFSWSQSDGKSGSGVVTYNQYSDLGSPQSTYSGDDPPISSTTTSVSVVGNTITMDYTIPDSDPVVSGTCSFTLGGTLFDDTAIGPFDPNDATHGWAALTALTNALLDNVAIPNVTDSINYIVILPISTSPGYTTISETDPEGDNIDCAAANGFPSRTGAAGWEFSLAAIPSITDFQQPFATIASQIVANQGACFSSKAIWTINGTPAAYSDTVFTVNNNHQTLYSMGVTFPGGVTTGGTVNVVDPNPLPFPNYYTWEPADVAAAVGGSGWGMLGFLSAAS